MENRILRTIGASVILACLVVAGLAQVSSGRDAQPVQIAVEDPAVPETTTVDEASPSEAPSTTLAPEPFVYRVGLLSGVSTTNFWAYYGRDASVWNTYVLGLTKASLFEVDRATGQLVPDLSVGGPPDPTWDIEGWKVEVPIAHGREWSDGTPVTAHDFAFTFETVRSLQLGGSWADSFPATVTTVDALEDDLVLIRFSERPDIGTWPHGPGVAPAMAAHIWDEEVAGTDAKALYEMDGSRDVSSGPFALESVADTLVVSIDNPGHPGAPSADIVEYHVLGNDDALLQALESGAIDTILTPKGLTPAQVQALSSNPGVDLLTSTGHGVRYLGFNLDRQPMADLAYRRAMALLLDRAGLADSVANASLATSFIGDSDGPWSDDERSVKVAAIYDGELEQRLTTALEGLTEAGYTWDQAPSIQDGRWIPGSGLKIKGVEPQPLTILTPGDAYDPTRPEYVAAIAEVLAFLGFDARPVETDFDTVVDLAFTPGDDGSLGYDMYVLGWTLGNPALPEFYRPLFAENGEVNNTGYQSQAFGRALQAFETAHSHEQARKALWDMETVLATELPYLLLYNSQLTEAYRSDRVSYGGETRIGGIQGALGAPDDLKPVDGSTLAG